MATPNAPQDTAAAVAPPRLAGVAPWVLGLACGILVAIATPSAILAGTMLAPSALMLVFDKANGKPIARCMILCGLAASVRALVELWSGGHTITLALRLIADPDTLLFGWVSQAAGWVLVEIASLAMTLVQAVRVKSEIAAFRKARADLEQTWGIPPAAEPDPTAQATATGGATG